MTARRLLTGAVLITALAIVVNSCKDLGEEVPAPPVAPLSVSVPVVNLGPSGQARVLITGGYPPYTISQHPDTALASARLSMDTLLLQAVANVVTPGTTSVKIKDTEPHGDLPNHGESEITIVINVSAIPIPVAIPSSVSVGTGQTVPVRISGGRPPYQIAVAPDANLATASFLNPNDTVATLNITGVSNASAAGSTFVRIKGSYPGATADTVRVPITKTQ